MMILAVDDSAERLHELVRLLSSVFPEDTIVAESDALAAGKFAFNNPVDTLFAAAEMPRLDGCKLMEFVRHVNPNAMVFLLTAPDGAFDGELWAEEADGLLRFPTTETALFDALRQARHKRETDQ